MLNNKIGVFDSGVGGLTVWQQIVKLLPNQPILYFADSKNCPYGSKSKQQVKDLSERIVRFFVQQGCGLITIACNTITAAAVDYFRKKYPQILFVGMEPATKPAASQTKTGRIGILATQNTFQGEKFVSTRNKYAKDIQVEIQIGYGLVEIVEEGKADSEEAYNLLKKYIDPMLAHQVDQIVLGCTHYPFLLKNLKRIIGSQATIIEPSLAVAKRVKILLEENSLVQFLSNQEPYVFYTSGSVSTLRTFLKSYSALDFQTQYYPN
ncbi:MAG: glutamate racemase [Spirochaetes bacterium]|nr:glutamate racemase [Spirochaetota bacterium]